MKVSYFHQQRSPSFNCRPMRSLICSSWRSGTLSNNMGIVGIRQDGRTCKNLTHIFDWQKWPLDLTSKQLLILIQNANPIYLSFFHTICLGCFQAGFKVFTIHSQLFQFMFFLFYYCKKGRGNNWNNRKCKWIETQLFATSIQSVSKSKHHKILMARN